MRINQFIAHYSNLSRREADLAVQEKRVKINFKIAQNGDKITSKDKVFLDGKMISKRAKIPTLIVYNKPKGELVTKKDSFNRRRIFDSLDAKFAHFTSIGRLDYSSEGLLILSDDKSIASALEKSKMPRTYLVKIDSPITKEMTFAMENGLVLEDAKKGAHPLSKIEKMTFAPFLSFEVLKSGNFSKLKISISEGQNREIRRFFAHFNAEVLDLKRISFGFISLNALPTSKSRFLNKLEYKKLHEFLKPSDRQSRHL
ncbi:MAG: pseudouridine synthase [Helicobacter sp.]|nr:pseudouridine synthase [Helicobacter sp.]